MTARPVLPRNEAAAYVGCRDAAQFMREVRKGLWPEAIVNSRPPRWSRAALDRRISERDGGATPAGYDWDKHFDEKLARLAP